MKEQIEKCMSLYKKLGESYKQKNFDIEKHLRKMKTGELDVEQEKLKEYREEINKYPQKIKAFCQFVVIAKCPEEDIEKFLLYILQNLKFPLKKEDTFLEKQRKNKEIAEKIGIEPSNLTRLLFNAQSVNLLKNYELNNEYVEIIKSYLEK